MFLCRRHPDSCGRQPWLACRRASCSTFTLIVASLVRYSQGVTTRRYAKPKTLADYPRPSVAVDVAVLTVHGSALDVVVVEHRLGGRALPGTFLHADERLADAASRALAEKAALTDVDFAQLQVFDDPTRDDRGWVLSVGHTAAVPFRALPPGTQTVVVTGGRPDETLLFDHAEIVELAVAELRRQYIQTLDPAGLLDEVFTVHELRRTYEAIFGRPLVKDTFRRWVSEALEATGELSRSVGRPAELFRLTPGFLLPPAARAVLTEPIAEPSVAPVRRS